MEKPSEYSTSFEHDTCWLGSGCRELANQSVTVRKYYFPMMPSYDARGLNTALWHPTVPTAATVAVTVDLLSVFSSLL